MLLARRVLTGLVVLTLATAGSLALGGCPSPNDDGAGAGGGSSSPRWQVVFDDDALDRAVLSIWGDSSKSVFAVGGPLGNGAETLALHYDGTAWTDLHPGGTDTFWWVSGTSATDVWMVGENGRIAHYDGASFSDDVSGTNATLWGAMAFSPTDVWAVGGTPEGSAAQEDDVVLHFDGTAWAHETLPGAPLRRALFKVWGTSSDDLYVVGEAGTIWHRSATGWLLQSDPPIAGGTLFTVHGCSATEIYAVGGSDLLRSDGTTWTKMPASLVNGGSGVSCSKPGNLAVVGFGGLKQRYENGAWTDDLVSAPHGDLHSVWSDETGAYWAVGGDFVSKPKPGLPRNGTIARYGKGSISAKLE